MVLRVSEGCAHLPCLGSAISLCLEHWQPLGGISIPPREKQIPAVARTWEDRCTQEPANIGKLCMCVCGTHSEIDLALPGQ